MTDTYFIFMTNGVESNMSRSPDQYKANRVDKNKDENLRGTFVSVLFIGGFILAMWLTVFYIYISVAL